MAIASAVEANVTMIDSGESAAAEVERVLDAGGLRNMSRERPNLRFLVSDIPAKFTEVGERFLGRKMGRVMKAGSF